MLNVLYKALETLPDLLSQTEKWDNLIVNRRKPHTYRVFTQWPVNPYFRICLHRFDVCDTEEAFSHPHPWEGGFLLLKGSYHMQVGQSINRTAQPTHVMNMDLHAGSSYAITEPTTWHSVTPYEETYTVMVNGQPWEKNYAHAECRTTKGKDLEKFSQEELISHLNIFKELIYRYNRGEI